MSSSTQLAELPYIAVVETKAMWQWLEKYCQQHGIDTAKVAWILVADDVAIDVQEQRPHYQIFSLTDVPQWQTTLEDSRQFVSKLQLKFAIAARQCSLRWTTLMRWHSEYLLQIEASQRLAQQLVGNSQPRQRWLLAPAGLIMGNYFDQYGGGNPLLYWCLRYHLEQRKQKFYTVKYGLVAHPNVLTAIEVLRISFNIKLLLLASFVNIIVGWFMPKQSSKPGGVVLAASEIATITDPNTLSEHLKAQKITVTSVKYNYVRLRFGATWQADLATIGRAVKQFLTPSQTEISIGQSHPLAYISRWITMSFFHWPGFRWSQLKTYLGQAKKDIQAYWQTIDQIYLQQTTGLPRSLQTYIKWLIVGFLPEYWTAKAFVQANVLAAKPRVVVYPDGYSFLGRLLQWYGQKNYYEGVLVPHGYPNRFFPGHYYSAQTYSAALTLTKKHLEHSAIPSTSIRSVQHERWRISQLPDRTSNLTNPVIGLFYIGTYDYWAFPNRLAEIDTLSREIIPLLLKQLPQARIILKTHPNGTSYEFIAGLQRAFPEAWQQGRITHVPQGWSADGDYLAVTAAISFLTFPSSPFEYFMRLGVPLWIIGGKALSYEQSMYEPSIHAIPEYPGLVGSVSEAVQQLTAAINDPQQYQVWRHRMIDYGQTQRAGIRPTLEEFIKTKL